MSTESFSLFLHPQLSSSTIIRGHIRDRPVPFFRDKTAENDSLILGNTNQAGKRRQMENDRLNAGFSNS
ncbi:MAG: hypothetical protein C4293_12080 [Nitrospiraceae bacterium]